MNEVLRLARTFFSPHQPTVDLGAGGRDLCELNASPSGRLANSVSDGPTLYPGPVRHGGLLPYLSGIPKDQFDNALCVGSLDLVGREDLITAILDIARIMREKGRVLLTWQNDPSLPLGKLILLLESAGFQVLLSQEAPGHSVVVAEKFKDGVSRGLERVQAVLAYEQKTATYKLALIRALAVLSRTAANCVRWRRDEVLVPMWSIARQWLIFYWPLVNHSQFVAQIRGETDGGSHPIAFRGLLRDLAREYGPVGLYDLLKRMDEEPSHFSKVLREIAKVIRNGPVHYSGTANSPVFAYEPSSPHESLPEHKHGWVVVPESVWLDISRFDHWIEDSLVVRWAKLTGDMNRHREGIGGYLELLLLPVCQTRDTTEIRGLLRDCRDLRCVWTDRPLSHQFEVDHLIPYSVWGNNDLWNLLPCHPRTNLEKRAQVPSLELIRRRADSLVHYWRVYRKAAARRFDIQLTRALGSSCGPGWERQAISGLMETVERLAATRGLPRWAP